MNSIILYQIVIGALILTIVNSEQSSVDSEFDDSGKLSTISSHKKRRLPGRNDLIKQQRLKGRDEYRARQNDVQSSELSESAESPDIDIHSEDREKKLVLAIERTDRQTLEEWYDYTFDLKGIIANMGKEARSCNCTDMYEPILDIEKIIRYGLKAISNRLKSDKVKANK